MAIVFSSGFVNHDCEVIGSQGKSIVNSGRGNGCEKGVAGDTETLSSSGIDEFQHSKLRYSPQMSSGTPVVCDGDVGASMLAIVMLGKFEEASRCGSL